MKFINVSTLLCLVALILTGAFLIGGYVPVWDIPTVDRAMEITRMNLDVTDSTEHQSFPCDWTKDFKIMKLADKTLQCTKVHGAVSVVYDISPNDPSDKFTVLVLNQTQYANYQNNKEYVCINEPQCRYGDTTTKTGSYSIPAGESEIITIIKNSNVVQRAFVRADLHVHAGKNTPYRKIAHKTGMH